MGNHCIDCEFCGQDRRTVGPDCCEERRKKDEKEHLDRLHSVELDARYLKQFGLVPSMDALGYGTKLDAKDVVGAIKKIKAGLL